MTIDRGVAQASDGEQIAWEARGRGDEAILLVMGLGGRRADWGASFVDALARDHRTILFDNRGTGDSSKPFGPYTLRQLAADGAAVLDAVGVQRAHVVGTSMGGMIAQRMAIDHPHRVHRLVLGSTNGGGRGVVPPMPDALEALMAVPGPRTDIPQFLAARYRTLVTPAYARAHPEKIDEMVQLALAQPTPMHAFSAQLQAIMQDDRASQLSSIRAPTLVVHGDEDRLIPLENGRILASVIPGAKLEILRGCAHRPSWEQPEAFADVVVRFLDARD